MTRWSGGAGRLGRPAQLVRLAAHRPVLGFLDLAGRLAHRSDRRLGRAPRCARRRSTSVAGRSGLPSWSRASPSSIGPASRRAAAGVPERLGAVVLSVPAPFQPGVGRCPSRPATVSAPDSRRGCAATRFPYSPRASACPVRGRQQRQPRCVRRVPGRHGSGRCAGPVGLPAVAGTWVGGGLVLGGRVHRGTVRVRRGARACPRRRRRAAVRVRRTRLPGDRGSVRCSPGPVARTAGRSDMPELLRLAAAGEPGPAGCSSTWVGYRPTGGRPVHRAQSGRGGRRRRGRSATDLVAAGVREQIDLYAPPIARSAVTTVTSTLGVRAEPRCSAPSAWCEHAAPGRGYGSREEEHVLGRAADTLGGYSRGSEGDMSEHEHDHLRVALQTTTLMPDGSNRSRPHRPWPRTALTGTPGTGTTPRCSGTGSGGAWRWPSRSCVGSEHVRRAARLLGAGRARLGLAGARAPCCSSTAAGRS